MLENTGYKYQPCLGVLAAVIFLQLSLGENDHSAKDDEDNEADCFLMFTALVKQMACFMFEDETNKIDHEVEEGGGNDGGGMFDDEDVISPMDTLLHSM